MQHELITVATYPNAIAAHAAMNFLAENGIRAFIADENFANLYYPVLVSARLQVAATDADRAKALLAVAHS